VRSALATLVLALALPLGAAACDSGDDRPPYWSFIQPAIIQPSCSTARCHSKFTATQGLRFDSIRDSYTYLVTGDLVIPKDPEDSRLMWLLRGEETLRMPPDGPLPRKDIDLIEAWILGGALESEE